MKNIHVLPTDKPSRLYKSIDDKLSFTDIEFEQSNNFNTNQNIYITSDEEIKEGDWVIYKKFMFPLKVVLDQDGYHIINNGVGEVVRDYYSLQERYKKIILTTDQDLIKDGVQAIDDEFLEWFVKNPSCEVVEVEDYGNLYNFRYLILIPKEEPKQETTSEGFHRISKEFDYPEFDFVSFKIGTEWQQEQFSKSEFIQLVRATKSDAEARRIIREYFK